MFRKQTLILIFGDVLALILALWLSLFLRYALPPTSELFYLHFYPFSFIFALWILALYIAGFYSRQVIVRKIDFLPRLLKTQLISSLIAASIFYLTPFFKITPKTNLFLILVASFILLSLWRKMAYWFFRIKGAEVLLIAEGCEADELSGELLRHPFYGFSVRSQMTPQEFENQFGKDGARFLEFMEKNNVSLVVADFSTLSVTTGASLFYKALFEGTSFLDFRDFYENIYLKVPASLLHEKWFLENITGSGSYELWKRSLDIIFSLIFCLPALILFPFIALAIKVESAGPIFFRQRRVGQGEKIFELIKFRSSYRTSIDETVGWEKEPNSIYTKVGAFMRKTYLDEIPQVINILKGDMSFVGPRPERLEFVKELAREIPFYKARLLVSPGITGWAQINMENDAAAADAQEKMQYDLYYVKHCSFFLDIRILLKTIATVLSRTGR